MDSREPMVPLADVQRESARANEQGGVIAFLVGALDEISKSSDLASAKTCAMMGMQTIEEWRAGLWVPGPHDDPADWRCRRG